MTRDNSERGVEHVNTGRVVIEGAGVRLRRFIGTPELDYVDPFLLLDEFRSDDPRHYIAGFPWHPHRGIETVTYMIQGQVRHGDSIGNRGVIGPGDVQWMTAGQGIIHEEMPEQRDGLLWGFQLWVNLPARLKLCDPRYQEVPSDTIPLVQTEAGASVRVIAGSFRGMTGPVTEIAARPTAMDVHLPPRATESIELPAEHTAACHLYEGGGRLGDTEVTSAALATLTRGARLVAHAGGNGMKLLLVAGLPLNEPVARGGPFVMNTREEIEQAFREYHAGTFLKPRG